MEVRAEIVGLFIKEALQEYKTANRGALPEKIVIYRDGFGTPTMFENIKLFGKKGNVIIKINAFLNQITLKT
jgi:hypothetical protein